jgi:hypothetical protein
VIIDNAEVHESSLQLQLMQKIAQLTDNGGDVHLLIAMKMREMPALAPPASADEDDIGGGCDIIVVGGSVRGCGGRHRRMDLEFL